MAGQEGKKDEDKVEFDSAGEALGYISLDQAQVLAMRTARDQPGDYGADFRAVRMAYEVAETDETEDHYVVTLSFRPEGRFAGTPGQEQFYIEKEGAVAVRQVLSLPARAWWRSSLALGAAGVLVVGAAVIGVVFASSLGGDEGPAPVAGGVATSTPEPQEATPTTVPSVETVPPRAKPTAAPTISGLSPAFSVTALPETSATWPKGTDFGGLVSQTDDPVGPWSGASVHFGGTDQGGGTEKFGAASLIYRYRLEFGEVTALTSITVSGTGFTGPSNVLRVLDENMNVVGSVDTFGGNTARVHTLDLIDVQGKVFFIDEFDVSNSYRYRGNIAVTGQSVPDDGGSVANPSPAPLPAGATPNFPAFADTRGLNVLGDALQLVDVIRLTDPAGDRVGAVWFNDRLLVRDGFETTFRFRLTGAAGSLDGLAFVIQTSGANVNGIGGDQLGYGRFIEGLAVEFDVARNSNFKDPSDNHISIHTGGGVPALDASEGASIGSVSPNIVMSDGAVHTAKIEYTPGRMMIFLDDLANPILEVSLDIADIVALEDGKAWVGFTSGGVNGLTQSVDVLSWSFSPGP